MSAQGEATFSGCGRYRYRLTRELNGALFAGSGRAITFIMLNPSTADANADDPTIRRCKGFARGWGYGRLIIVNLFAFRATDPRDMWKAHEGGVDIVGEQYLPHMVQIGPMIEARPPLFDNRNDGEIWKAALESRLQTGTTQSMGLFGAGKLSGLDPGIVICGWGKGGGKTAKHAKIIAQRAERVARLIGGDLWCLGTNEDGSPKHPLYLAEDTPAQIWRAA